MTINGHVLEGKGAIVTGGANGIGLATARTLAAHGANVLIVDLDESAARDAAERTDRASYVAADLTRDDAADGVAAAAVELFGGIDIVVNNAGYNLNAAAHKMTDSQWTRMFDIHVTAPFRLLRAAAPHLFAAAERDRAAGAEVFRKVVNVSSCAVMGTAGQANYAAAKAAVVGLTKSLAKEWGPYKINVNAVAFGSIDTRLTRPREPGNVMHLDGEELQLGLSPRLMAGLVETIPLGRIGTAQEAADSVFLLCSPWSNWIHGQLLMVTGGQVLGMSS
jgi:3-oxoacyl-[acyl-carrier protein] reductase